MDDIERKHRIKIERDRLEKLTDALWEQFQQKRITHAEYRRQVDAIERENRDRISALRKQQ